MELEDTFIEEYSGAVDELAKNRFKNSAILFSKSLFALGDLLLYNKLSKLPKNHSERFRLLEEYLPSIYSVIDEIFEHYTDAYTKAMTKETSIEIKNAIKKIIKNNEVPKRIKEIIE